MATRNPEGNCFGFTRGIGKAVRNARIEHVEAEDGVDAAKAALDKIQSDVTDYNDGVRLADDVVHAAINSLLRPVAESYVARLEELRAETRAVRAVLNLIIDQASIPFGIGRQEVAVRAAPLKGLWEKIESTMVLNFRVGQDVDAGPMIEKWKAAIQALTEDPNAEIPIQ